MSDKQRLNFWQIWNMSFGFLGIQFGWALQMANMSAIYEYLGARADQIPILWLAAPLTGLLVQPIIGHASDRTWNRLGRRRPYFLTGAILSSAALIVMPRVSALWMAAGLLWILDVSINISMEPFRAFVADMLPEEQRTRGFAMQSLFIGLGAVVASVLPGFLLRLLGNTTGGGRIPLPVRISFYIGAAAFFGAVIYTIATTREYPPEDLEAFRKMKAEKRGLAENVRSRISFYIGAAAFFGAVIYTIATTREYPPEDLEAFRKMKAEKRGLAENAREIFESIAAMPQTMKQLAWVQFFTWLGLFCMFLYFSVAVAHNVFGASDPHSALYTEGVAWGGYCFAMYSAVCFVWSFALPPLANALGRKATHSLCLLCGAAGLMSVAVIHNKWLLLFSMVGVGIAWASILSMPYVILAGSLPAEKTGIYMGIFNFFIVRRRL